MAQAASALMTILTENRDDRRVAEELCVPTCVDHRGELDAPVAWWNWWEYVVHDDAQAWFWWSGGAGRGAPSPDELRSGTRQCTTRAGRAARTSRILIERARRELARMLDRDPGARARQPARAPSLDRDAARGHRRTLK